MKRLFLLAAYSADGLVDKTLIHLAKSLATFGDVIIYADSDIPSDELGKFDGIATHCEASRHGEYDFGSYKRCWQWAKANLPIQSYDFLYLVNDSVFGPLFPLDAAMEIIESKQGLGGMVFNPSRHGCHVQSWFEKVPREFFMTREFDALLESVTKEENKNRVCAKYETGLTSLAISLGIPVSAYLTARGNTVYNNVFRLFRKGVPFIKKSAITRHNGSLGLRVKLVLMRITPLLRSEICEDIDRVNGRGYSDRFLTLNPIRIIFRYLGYLLGKIGRS